MQHVFYLLLRRLRAPIITIISVYAISILGFVLIPGQDDQGNPWHMDFFHAFYFVSFMGTTIGFGEIPYPFTPQLRLWSTITIYATVVSWLYSIGTIFGLFQEPNFRRLLKRRAFNRRIERIHEPFYLICGYGITGNLLAHRLDRHNIKSVVIESDQRLIDELEADEIALSTPYLCADAADPDTLNLAGIQDKNCVGVLALTNNDHTNLSIAIDSKLVRPERLVISRTQSKETTANLASFGTDFIVDPFECFAEDLMLALREPYKHLIYDLIINPRHSVLSSPYQKTQGRWVVCGYGRFGMALETRLSQHGIDITFIEPDPAKYKAPEGTVTGVGTEAETLIAAGIESAVGVVAGTPDDADNLSIIITARDIKPDLITVARQNIRANKPVFRAAEVNMIMEPGRIIANEIYMRIRAPLLPDFFELLFTKDKTWSRELFLRISALIGTEELDVWTISINAEQSQAVYDALRNELKVTVGHLYLDPRDREDRFAALPLLLERNGEHQLVPDEECELQIGDKILFCGLRSVISHMNWTISNHNALRYIRTGREGPDGIIWRKLSKRRRQKAAQAANSIH